MGRCKPLAGDRRSRSCGELSFSGCNFCLHFVICGSCLKAAYRGQDIAGVMTSSSVAFDQNMLHSPFRNASEVGGRSRVCDIRLPTTLIPGLNSERKGGVEHVGIKGHGRGSHQSSERVSEKAGEARF